MEWQQDEMVHGEDMVVAGVDLPADVAFPATATATATAPIRHQQQQQRQNQELVSDPPNRDTSDQAMPMTDYFPLPSLPPHDATYPYNEEDENDDDLLMGWLHSVVTLDHDDVDSDWLLGGRLLQDASHYFGDAQPSASIGDGSSGSRGSGGIDADEQLETVNAQDDWLREHQIESPDVESSAIGQTYAAIEDPIQFDIDDDELLMDMLMAQHAAAATAAFGVSAEERMNVDGAADDDDEDGSIRIYYQLNPKVVESATPSSSSSPSSRGPSVLGKRVLAAYGADAMLRSEEFPCSLDSWKGCVVPYLVANRSVVLYLALAVSVAMLWLILVDWTKSRQAAIEQRQQQRQRDMKISL